MSTPTPEERARWRQEAVDLAAARSRAGAPPDWQANRVRALLDALAEAETHIGHVEGLLSTTAARLNRATALLRLRSAGVVTADAFPMGLRCGECHRLLLVGEPYAERLLDVAVVEGRVSSESVLLVCEACS